MSRARDLSKLGNTGVFSVSADNNVGVNSTVPVEKLNVVGVVSATSFYGDGSQLEGVASAGLGTAVIDDSPYGGEQIYYTNKELRISGNLTVDVPDSAEVAYTQYQEIVVDSGADFIVGDGDDFIPDILGIGSDVQQPGLLSGGGGRVRADNFSDKSGTGAPTFSSGVVVTGVATATSFSGNLTGNASGTSSGLTGTPDINVRNITGVGLTLTGNVSIGGTLTYEDVTNVDSIGIVTARNGIEVSGIITAKAGAAVTYYGDGSNLTGIASTDNINAGSLTVAGISTFNGDAEFKKLLQEPCNIVASNLTTSPNIDLENGMFYYFSTNETGVGKANIRYSSTEALMSKMEIGDTVCVTIMTRPNNAGYNQGLDIDGQNVNVSWLGGSQPTSANSGGFDLYTYQIIKHSATGTYANDTHVLAHITNYV